MAIKEREKKKDVFILLSRARQTRPYDQMPSSVLEGERFIPRCKNGVPLKLLVVPLRLVIYPLPSVSLENPTQIAHKDPKTGNRRRQRQRHSDTEKTQRCRDSETERTERTERRTALTFSLSRRSSSLSLRGLLHPCAQHLPGGLFAPTQILTRRSRVHCAVNR